MKITYLGHSGFLVETKEQYLLFDYYTGKLPVFSPEKALTILVSHAHQDHYNKEIFAQQDRAGAEGAVDSTQAVGGKFVSGHRPITYVLSKDIPRKQAEALVLGESELLFVKAHETYALQNGKITIETLRSTDEGVAFVVTVEEDEGQYHFYHAGDLNLWKWPGETKAYQNNMEAAYRREMERLRGRHFNAAFVPLDPRLEQSAFGGLDIFLDVAEADVVFPMHFWNQPEIVGEYLRARPQVENVVMPK